MSKGTSAFVKLRRALAPSLRTLLEHSAILRYLGVKAMSSYLKPTVQWDGHTVSVDPTDFGVSFELESTGEYEAKSMEYCKSFLKPGMTFVDVGANVGLFTLTAARQVGPTGKVFSFEPDGGNCGLLKKNIGQNHYANVTAVQKAVTDRSGQCTLFQSGFNTGDHRTYHVSDDRKQVTIECVSLDDYFPAGTKIDMIKMDIEGSEETALKGMERIINEQRPQLIIECWPSMLKKAGTNPHQMFKSIEDRGYALSLIDDASNTITSLSAEKAVDECIAKEVANILCVPR